MSNYAKFMMSVHMNEGWTMQAGTDSLTELDLQLKKAVVGYGRDNVKLYVMLEVPLEPEARDEELEEYGVIPGNYRPGCPSPDRHVVDHHPDHLNDTPQFLTDSRRGWGTGI